MTHPAKHFYEFGPFRVDSVSRLLLRDRQPVSLMPKVFELLLVLVENRGRVLEKDELMKALWPDSFVEEANLTVNISALRKALGESPNEHRYVVTVPGRGYKFVAGVREAADESAELILEERTRSRVVVEGEKEGNEQEETPVEAQAALPLTTAPTSRRRTPVLALLAVALLVVGLVIAIFYLWKSNRPKTTIGGAAIRSIAVLPFKPLVADSRDESLEMGMTDSLITKLSNINQIIVRPISAVRKYTGLEQDPVGAGRELTVDSVLDGSIQKSGEKIRVTVRLVRIEDGQQLWAEKVDYKLTDIFTAQDLISERVAGALAVRLTGTENDLLARHYTENLEAYQLYMKGRHFWNKRTSDELKRAIEYFQQAVEKDPRYALAHAGIADCYNVLGNLRVLLPDEAFPKAREAATKALDVDDTLGEAHSSLAFVRFRYDWDFPEAEREYTRAIQLSPNYPTAHQWYAAYLAMMGRLDEGLAEIKRAQELDPVSPIISMNVGRLLSYAGQYDKAIQQLRNTLELDPNFNPVHSHLGLAYQEKGMTEEAIAQYMKRYSNGPQEEAALREAYSVSGWKGFWQKEIEFFRERSKRMYIPPFDIAVMYGRVGEKDQAFAWFEGAYKEREPRLLDLDLRLESDLDGLRSDPRFSDLLRRIGLPQQSSR